MMKLATVFSGVGAIEQALLKKNIKHDIIFACDNGERYIDVDEQEILNKTESMTEFEKQSYIKEIYDETGKTNYVKKTYFLNYKVKEENWYEDIRFINGDIYKNQVDLFVGGSPCQSFSLMGKRGGLEDTRGTLFYNYANLIKQIQPKVFVFENVLGILSHDGKNTWQTIEGVFEALGYKIFGPKTLNAVDFGIPQNRKRVFVVGFKNKNVEFKFPTGNKEILHMSNFFHEKKRIPAKHYLGEKGFKFVTSPKYRGRARVNRDIIRTQKANQQFNWNGDFIFEPLEKVEMDAEIMGRAYVGKFNGEKGVIRQMTHRECFNLMGFPKTFKIDVPNIQAYRQAGNSIVVNVLEAIVEEIMKVVDFK